MVSGINLSRNELFFNNITMDTFKEYICTFDKYGSDNNYTKETKIVETFNNGQVQIVYSRVKYPGMSEREALL